MKREERREKREERREKREERREKREERREKREERREDNTMTLTKSHLLHGFEITEYTQHSPAQN